MKNHYLLVRGCILLLLIAACSPTNRLTMNATEPAAVYVSPDIQKIGIVNRSAPSEANKTLDKIDQILSLEGLKLDKEGADRVVMGLYDELSATERFAEIVVIDQVDLPRGGLAVFPATLPWRTIEELCTTYDVDAIFSLEFFDTDTRAHYKLTTMTVPNDLGIKAKIPAHGLTLNTQIKNGWRIYDPQRKLILDELSTYDMVSSKGEGINPVKALEAVVGRKEAVLQVSTHLGTNYAFRLRPLRKRIARDYYVRGTDKFKIAQRRAQAGDWNGAALLWEEELSHSKAKVAGRACYNMAIINEINGDLNAAMEWAARSYTDYNDNNALRYLNILKHRNAENIVLERQLSK